MEIGEGETRCYWIEPTGTGRIVLRRFTFGPGSDRGHACPASSNGCDASRELPGEHPLEWHTGADGYTSLRSVPLRLEPARSSSAWPRRCAHCGQPFPRSPVGMWQINWAEGYTRADNGEHIYARHAMGRGFAGALFDGRWLHGAGGEVHKVKDRGDGIRLVAVTPNGLPWVVDGEATGEAGGYWEREGDPRKPETLSVTPSIRAGDYHGYLTAGVFTAHQG